MDSIPPPRIKTPVEKKQQLDNTDKLRTRLIKNQKAKPKQLSGIYNPGVTRKMQVETEPAPL